jgi:hypothetical protein
MGAKTWMLVYADRDAREALKSRLALTTRQRKLPRRWRHGGRSETMCLDSAADDD